MTKGGYIKLIPQAIRNSCDGINRLALQSDLYGISRLTQLFDHWLCKCYIAFEHYIYGV